jgi:Na+/proline symporter
MLTWIDFFLVVMYFAIVLFIGIYSARKEKEEDFLIADRKVGVFSGLSTIMSSKIGAGLFVSFIAFIYAFGISALWLFFGFSIGYIVFFFFTIRLRKYSEAGNYYTMSDYFFNRYGKSSGYLTAAISFLNYFLLFVVQLIAGAKILSVFTGLTYPISLLIITLSIAFYLSAGGFKAVIKTDVIQYLAIFILFGIILIFLFTQFQYEPTQWNFFAAGKNNLISFLIGGILYPLASAELWQRVYALKNIRTVKKTLFLSAVFYPLIGIVIALIGMIIKLRVGGLDPDIALVAGFSSLLPAGLIGISIVAVFAAIMSSADTHLYTTTSFFVQNVVFSKETLKVKLVKFMRLWLILFAVGGFLFAFFMRNLVEATLIFSGVIILLSIVILATWIHERISQFSLNLGLIFGVLSIVIYFVFYEIEPAIVMVAVFGSLIGLFIGGLIKIVLKKIKPI